ncbi:uncharacterized protein LOC131152947 isoform X2 [Malania oleifera]|uniref:uncharacterized protein LOC131152947 isoform X2 n=1 Tax=Malania oleifera TaxID=397392 RepID=UPI0025ADA741|nr:uncharacterized protein LOC131152947 isoform X2 [Malania oleifera]
MACVQITACCLTFNPMYMSQTRCLPSLPCFSPSHTRHIPRISLRQPTNASSYQLCTPVCLFGGKGKSENDEASPWKALEKAMGSFKKEESIENVLRQQIEKQEYFDDGGSGGNPPRSGGDDSGGSEDEGMAGIFDELLQVILATIGFIFLYIFIIHGEEITRLAKDYIKYLFGGSKSVRLKRAMFKWRKFFERLMPEVEEDPFWLERAIINTPTWWDSPEKYRRIIRHYLESKPSQ